MIVIHVAITSLVTSSVPYMLTKNAPIVAHDINDYHCT